MVVVRLAISSTHRSCVANASDARDQFALAYGIEDQKYSLALMAAMDSNGSDMRL
jgi:hypothetical protein